jgi:hypothetical protein
MALAASPARPLRYHELATRVVAAISLVDIATAEMTFCLHVADHRLDGGATSEPAFDAAEHPALLA